MQKIRFFHSFQRISISSSISLQPVHKQRQETWSLGRGQGQAVGGLVWTEQRTQLLVHQEQRLWRARHWQGAREGEGEGWWWERRGGAAKTCLDPLHPCWELLLQWSHGPSGTVFTLVLIICVSCSVVVCYSIWMAYYTILHPFLRVHRHVAIGSFSGNCHWLAQ